MNEVELLKQVVRLSQTWTPDQAGDRLAQIRALLAEQAEPHAAPKGVRDRKESKGHTRGAEEAKDE